MKSVEAITVFIAEKPAPFSGSNRARKTDSRSLWGRRLRQIRPASKNDAPKPSIFWYVTESSTTKFAAVGAPTFSKPRIDFGVIRSPAFEDTKVCTSCATVATADNKSNTAGKIARHPLRTRAVSEFFTYNLSFPSNADHQIIYCLRMASMAWKRTT